MYFKKCERLREQLPEFSNAIATLDELLVSFTGPTGGRLYPTRFAAETRLAQFDADRILEEATELGLLERRYTASCPITEEPIVEREVRDELPRRLNCDICLRTHKIEQCEISVHYRISRRHLEGPTELDDGELRAHDSFEPTHERQEKNNFELVPSSTTDDNDEAHKYEALTITQPVPQPSQQRFPKTLLQAITSNRLIPFAGAGVSMAVRDQNRRRLFPSWNELFERAAKKIEDECQPAEARVIRAMLESPKPDSLYLARRAKDALGANWYSFLREQFNPRFSLVDQASLELARSLWNLGSKLIITTNYDNVLRWASPIPEDHSTWHIESPANLVHFLRDQLHQPTSWHLHGFIDKPDEIVLTDESYRALYEAEEVGSQYQSATSSLKTILATYHLIFVGFSFEDQKVREQVEQIHQQYAGAGGPHYILLKDSEAKSFKHNKGDLPLEVITFPDFGTPLIETLKSMAAHAATN